MREVAGPDPICFVHHTWFDIVYFSSDSDESDELPDSDSEGEEAEDILGNKKQAESSFQKQQRKVCC